MINTLIIVQARMGSTRLPDKVMRQVGDQTLIEFLLRRLARVRTADRIILATTTDLRDNVLANHVEKLGFAVYRGSVDDVLDRYYQAGRAYSPQIVVRITGDCPLMDPALVDDFIKQFQASGVDYLSNKSQPTFPDGLDIEVFRFTALEQAWREAKGRHNREHVTPYLRESGKFTVLNVRHTEDLSTYRWTVDELEDLKLIEGIVAAFAPRSDFSWREVLKLSQSKPALFAVNRSLVRDEGATLGQGQKLWRRAKRVIPGGSMLLSKRAEMYLPERWPAYFCKAKGCRVWDLDNRELIDMSLMGIGTNILGYGHPEVDEAVARVVHEGNMSTLNCPEEVYLAERLVELHPWSGMVRFARSGGEANAISIRIARAASGRDKVAFCGYHGWHDWYLAANLGDEKNLTGHLLPGLSPTGVPRDLRGSILPFTYNRFDELETLVRDHDVGTIKMEVMRNVPPENNFLQRVRDLATTKKIVLIFDECTSGFRQSFGGLHKFYGVNPDMATFGKALGNGYAITGVIGRSEIMNYAQSTFISSTFWTERIGPAAALKTLEVMERVKSWETITMMGRAIAARWEALGKRYGLPLRTFGLPSMISFHIDSPNMLAYKTLVTQEMLKRGFLASTSIYVCIEHTVEIVDAYFAALEPVFGLIQECERGRSVESLLEGPTCHAGFRRLN